MPDRPRTARSAPRTALSTLARRPRPVAVPDDLFAALREHLDDRQVVELAATVAAYAMVSRFLVALQVPPPEGEVSG